ncbi:MAG: type II toxin-antitoxin system RelE/ParE family toxin [Prolixibacteraceae bacterium]|nr:type II toxin-antitoxin system RelE/ParE family toxin [Prolixibacteraceae bacterium]
MPYPVRYSTRSNLEYEEILHYVFNAFGAVVASKVDSYFEKVIGQIAINPNLYPYSEKKKNLKRCVISPQTTLYYRFNGEYVEIVSFRGNRMNPATLIL